MKSKPIRVVSLDITGTFLGYRIAIGKIYHDSAHWARLTDVPQPDALSKGFKRAFVDMTNKYPIYGKNVEYPKGREWWRETVVQTFANCGRNYDKITMDRCFRRIYQQFAHADTYEIIPDAQKLFHILREKYPKVQIGIITNAPLRTVETVLPILNVHDYFLWSISAEEFGYEKPHRSIFDQALQLSRFWDSSIMTDEIVHIGDNFEADFVGAKAAGFQALYLNRGHKQIATDTSAFSKQYIQDHTIDSLEKVFDKVTFEI